MIFIAAVLQSAAYLFTNQLGLRILLLCGTLLYLTYYFVASETPLWSPIIASSAVCMTSIYGLIRVLLDQSRLFIRAEDIAILERFPGLEPGVFRRLLKLGQIRYLRQDEELAVSGIVPDTLSYILSGNVKVSKSMVDFEVGEGTFIGEVSMIQGVGATATVTGNTHTRIIEWDRQNLSNKMVKDERLRLAVEALLTRDIAKKLAQAAKID
ncbi:cyclic nucleotide-binding domain-containing protein [Saccharospirillum impatiens]|uniref:cyclic nucleotide-binding domain-containing protein n=1 Tax=Saccharospirillum impatiens TaxID=169438 RepID=UPI00146E66C8|nr:cyclic nucleotide-binding domain-containing protein [Saccharospirillum impatiens]